MDKDQIILDLLGALIGIASYADGCAKNERSDSASDEFKHIEAMADKAFDVGLDAIDEGEDNE